METLSERAKKLGQSKIEAAKKREAAELREKTKARQERELKAEIERQIAWMMGTTIRDLHKAGKLTPRQCLFLGEILALREDKPRNWDLLADYLPPARLRHPVVADPLTDAAAE